MNVKIVESADGRALKDAIGKLTNTGVKVGWFAKSKYDNDEKTPVAQAAVSNEYGNPKRRVPARPFIRPTIADREKVWTKLITDGSKRVLKNDFTIPEVMNLLGSDAVGDIKKTIKKVYYPALAQSTILARIERDVVLSKRKGQLSEAHLGNVTKPLIDTGIMYNTLTHELTGS